MSVVPMKRVQIVGLKRDRKAVLEQIQRMGVVEIESSLGEDAFFTAQDTAGAKSIFQKNCTLAEQALAILDEHAPEDKGMLASLEGRKTLTVAEYEEKVRGRDTAVTHAKQIVALQKEYAEKLADLPKLEAQKISLEPWMKYDLPLDFEGTKTSKVFVGTVQGDCSLTALYEALGDVAADAEIIGQTPQQTYLSVICGKKDAQAVAEALHKLNFAKPPASSMNPAKAIQDIEQKMEGRRKEVDDLKAKIASHADQREELQFARDYFTMRADKYEVIGGLGQSKNTFIIDGYVPVTKAEKLETSLTDRYTISVELTDPGEDEDVPVALKNNGFSAPVESVVGSYSLPGKGEIDPTFLVSLFYYFLFGMMLGDAGYGLVIALATGFCLLKFKNMEEGMRKTLTLFCFCGISTAIWGLIFGSFFGDTVTVVSGTFFGKEVSVKPLWFAPLDNPMRMLGYCFLIGLIHLFVGLGVKLYQLLKAGKVLDAIYDVVFWYMLVGGCVVYLLSMSMITEMLAIEWLVPANVANIAGIVAGIGAVGIILTGGRESKNWGKRILKGLYAFYGITSYLSDVLSYSRLLALGLATSVIASVFNKMGSMGGKNIFGVIMFILVFLVGQILNLLINLLGAYVHTNRLQFVEFFGKFYEGGGREFRPFTENTKYFKIKEDI
ncbi:MAG: V-type ATP synthase subunit I [Lachnospiraceae bacterium]|nr:V-type ATP synthase subunit I [Lachnospiraceae bacterium]